MKAYMTQKNSFNKMAIAFMTVCMILFASTAWAQTEVTVEKAGTLSTLLPESEKSAKIAGSLNGTDIKYLRDLIINHSLISLDLSEASIDGVKKFASSEILETYNLNSSANVVRIKDALQKKEVIAIDSDDKVRILDPLFEYWFRNIYL